MRMRWLLWPMVVVATCTVNVFGEPEYVKEVRMDRVGWAPKLPGGKIRMLSIQGVKVHTNHCSRDGLELAKRMDLECVQVSTPRKPGEKTAARIGQELQEGDYDLYVFGSTGRYTLPSEVLLKLLEKVRDGKGLLLIGSSPLGMFQGQVLFDEIEGIGNGWKGYRFGKGRIASRNARMLGGLLESFTASLADDANRENRFYDLSKMVHWTAGRDPAVRIMSMTPARNSEVALGDTLACELAVRSAAGRSLEVAWQIRDIQNRTVAQGTQKSGVPPGQGKIELSLPSPGAGVFHIDLWLREGKNTLDWANTTVSIKGEAAITSVRLWKKLHRRGDRITGRVFVTGAKPGDRVRFSIVDGYNRLHVVQEQSLVSAAYADFDLEVSDPGDRAHRLNVELLSGQTVTARLISEFTIAHKEFPTYFVTSCQQMHPGPVQFRDMQALGRYYGFNSTRRDSAELSNRAGFIPEPFPFHLGSGEAYNEGHVWAEYRNKFIRQLPEWIRYGAGVINLGDDCSIGQRLNRPNFWKSNYFGAFTQDLTRIQRKKLEDLNAEWGTSFQKIQEVTFKAAAKLRKQGNAKLFDAFQAFTREKSYPVPFLDDFNVFRQYLNRTYGGIKGLNASWGTRFKSMGEIDVAFIQSRQTDANPSPWADYLMYQVDGFCEIIRHLSSVLERELPEAMIGMDASKADATVPYIGGGGQGRPLTYYMPYFRSSAAGHIKKLGYWLRQMPAGGVTMGIYRGATVQRLDRQSRVLLPLANQLHGIHYWKIVYAFEGDDIDITDFAKDGAEAVREARLGLADLVLGSERRPSEVGLFTSPPNDIASRLDDQFGSTTTSLYTFYELIEDLGMQHETLGPRELTSDVLFRKNYKVFVLPNVRAMGQREAEAVRDYVRQGGTLVADMLPAVKNLHSSPLKVGLLDDLFGVTRKKLAEGVEPKSDGMLTLEGKGELLKTLAEAAIELAGGEALGRVGKTPAVIVNKVGAGRAILLNCDLGTYPILRGQLEHQPVLRLWSDILSETGVEMPDIKVSASDTGSAGYDVYHYGKGSMKLLGFRRKRLEKRLHKLEEVTVTTPEKLHAYDCRSGKYLGHGQEFRLSLELHDVRFIAFLPYQLKGVDIDLPARVKQGQELRLSVNLSGPGPTDPGHPVFVRFIDPNGQTAFWFDKTVTTDKGRALLTRKLALNEMPGKWSVYARDAVTGSEQTVDFTVSSQ